MLHCIQYATFPSGQPVSVALSHKYKSARVRRLEAPDPVLAEVVPADLGVELRMPRFGIYAAVELE